MRYTLKHGNGGITRCYRFEVTRIFFVVHGIFIRGFVRLNMSLSFIQNDFFRKAEVVHGDVLFPGLSNHAWNHFGMLWG